MLELKYEMQTSDPLKSEPTFPFQFYNKCKTSFDISVSSAELLLILFRK